MGLGLLTPRLGPLAGAVVAAAVSGALAVPAAAEVPDAVRRMIEAAAETGDRRKLDAVIEAARATTPGDGEAIDTLAATGRQRVAAIVDERREEEQRRIRQAGIFQRWQGRGQLGGFQATGNTRNIGITGSLNIERVGIDWRHKLRASLDYQKNDDIITRQQYFFAYEPRFQIDPGLFAYALGQWDRDNIQGFRNRYAVSGGLGYQVMSGNSMQLAVKAGPAWRRTQLVNGLSESSIAALAGIDFDWRLAENIKLTQDTDLVAEGGSTAVAIIDTNNTTLNLVTGLEADLINSLTARLSYAIEYESEPPAGSRSTDTLTRFTLIYSF